MHVHSLYGPSGQPVYSIRAERQQSKYRVLFLLAKATLVFRFLNLVIFYDCSYRHTVGTWTPSMLISLMLSYDARADVQ